MGNTLSGFVVAVKNAFRDLYAWPVLQCGLDANGNPVALQLANDGTITATSSGPAAVDGGFVALPDNDTYTPPQPPDCKSVTYALISGTFTLAGVAIDISVTGPMVLSWDNNGGAVYAPAIICGSGSKGFASFTVLD